MSITHTSRSGKTYYLQTGPKRGGGTQHFFSTKPTGPLAQRLPAGFEVYETVNGQVFLRRQQPKLIRDDERDCLSRQLENPRAGHRYKVEVRGKVLTEKGQAVNNGILSPACFPFSPLSFKPFNSRCFNRVRGQIIA